MYKLVKYLNARFFCKHNWKSVDNSKYYFHFKCSKCDAEKGLGNFKIK